MVLKNLMHNRIMYRPGVVVRKIGMISGDLVVGISVAATGKNIYFDWPIKQAGA